MHPRKLFVGMGIVKWSPSPLDERSKMNFIPLLSYVFARPRFRYKQHSRLAYVPRKTGGIALINGACHLDKGHNTICTSWPNCQSAHCSHARGLQDPSMPQMHAKYTLFLSFMEAFLMCCLLGSIVACLLVPCTSRERSCDMVHYSCLDFLTAGLEQTTAFCMITHL
jgi:hypothetical protein